MVITDYMKTYGEQIFQILPRDHRQDIINDYEVTLKDSDRFEFLEQNTRKKIYTYLVEDFFETKCLTYANLKFKSLKSAQQAFNDNQKEIQIDVQLETTYQQQKEEFLRILELVKDIANVLDVDMPKFVIEEVKTNQMAVSKKECSTDQVSWDPFDDELTFKMYRELPDLKRFAQNERGELDEEVETDQLIQKW